MTSSEPPADDGLQTRADAVIGLLSDALAVQRADLTRAVDGQVLQYACSAQQDLQEIQRAQPAEPLRMAIEKLTAAISGLRALVDDQVAVDAGLEARALPVVLRALGS